MINLFPYEGPIRATLGMVLVGFAALSGWYVLLLPGAILVYTATHRYCPFYAAMGINRRQARENYYLSQIPRHNPAPVMVFDLQGRLKYCNDQTPPALREQIDVSYLLPSMERSGHYSRMYDADDRRYLVRMVPVRETDSVLCYCFDATRQFELQQEMIHTQKELIYAMGEIGENRSQETGNHVKRVAEYSCLLARLAGMDEQQANILKIASPMHDIGKVGIPDSILNKPGRLDAEEWAIMQTHAEIGYNLLRHSDRPILQAAAIVAREHHEKWDGSGYPAGICGEDIHLYGRITAVADVFDALGSDRVYKQAWPLEKILDLLQEQRAKHFDPRLIDLFVENLDEFLAIRDELPDVTTA